MWERLTWLAGSYVVIAGGIWKLGERADKVVAASHRKQTTEWLRGRGAVGASSFGSSFENAFVAVFGPRHVSWRCLFASSVASFGITTGLTALAIALGKDFGLLGSDLSTMYGLALLFNLIPDYFSLWKSRLILTWMSRETWPRILLWIGLDALTSVLIGVAVFAMFALSGGSFQGSWGDIQDIVMLDDNSMAGVVFSVPFYSTFLTSIWVCLYGCSGFVIRVILSARRMTLSAFDVLNVDESPFLSIAAVAIGLLTVIYLLIAPFAL